MDMLLCLVLCVLSPGQIRATASWQPSSLKVDLPGFARQDIHLSTLSAGAEIGLFSGRLRFLGEIGTGDARMPGWGMDGLIDLFWRAGACVDLWQQGPWSVGLAGDVRQWQAEDSFLFADRPFGTQLHLTTYRVRPTLTREIGPVMFYGGPSVIWPDGSVEVYWDNLRRQFSIKTKAEFGAFAGANWQIAPHVILTGEGEFTELGPAATVGAAVQF